MMVQEEEEEHDEYDSDQDEEMVETPDDADDADTAVVYENKPKTKTAADAEFLDTIETASVTDLHRSNLLRLQTTELLSACQLELSLQEQHVKWATVAHEYTTAVSSLIEGITEGNIQHDTKSPFHLLSDKKKPAVSCKGLAVEPVGCFQAGLGMTTPAGNANVLPTLDLVVKLPTAMFESKDYLRHRYFDKRNIVVWHVAKYLSQKQFQGTVGKVVWRYWKADPRKPVLLLIPPVAASEGVVQQQEKGKKRKKTKQAQQPPAAAGPTRTKKLKFRVQLHFGMQDTEWIPPLRLVPNRCNLATDDVTARSQHYNHALVEDASHSLEGLADVGKGEYPNWNAATVLAKVWCLQRGLLSGHDSLTTEQLGLLILYLYRTKQTNARMAPTQVLSALFKLLADTNWLGEEVEKPQHEEDPRLRKAPSEGYQDVQTSLSKRAVLVLPEEDRTSNQTIASCELAEIYAKQTLESPVTSNDPKTLMELYQKDPDLGPVFLDPTLTYNYLGRLSPSFLRLVQREAKKSLQVMHSQAVGRPFQYLLMTPVRFWTRYDAYMKIPLNSIVFGNSKLWGSNRADAGDYESVARGLVQVLRMALGDRVQAIRILSTGNGSIPTSASGTEDADEIPCNDVQNASKGKTKLHSPTGATDLVLGITLNPETCYRIVDRGPPADDVKATRAFLDLWGKKKAELRRFKDGAIVHAVVWESAAEKLNESDDVPFVNFQNGDQVQGGIVERIVQHVVFTHFAKAPKELGDSFQFSLRNIMATVDGVVQSEPTAEMAALNPLTAHKKVMKAFDDLSTFLRKHSRPSMPVPGSTDLQARLGVPLAIDAVEPLSPSLRYAELFPPLPHPFLGSPAVPGAKKISGAVQSDPIEIQIRFGASSKWPTDLKAMGAAKAAMLVQLLDGIEEMKQQGIEDCDDFDGPTQITPSHADVGFKGFVFRVFVRADPELRMLRGLANPSPEAVSLLRTLTRKHVVASTHHSLIHAVYTRYASSSAVTRMAKRWVSSHLLSGLIPFEAIELLVASVYTDQSSPLDAPGTVVAGFLRFLNLLGHHDWTREPLIVDPQGTLTDDESATITSQFDKSRGSAFKHGAPMYIVSPSDRQDADDDEDPKASSWVPSFTQSAPEWVVLTRATALAKRSLAFLTSSQQRFERNTWATVFHETTDSFKSYSALLRVDLDFVVDAESSSTGGDLDVAVSKTGVVETGYTRSMQARAKGPKDLRRKLYRNLMDKEDTKLLLEWRPVDAMVEALRKYLGPLAIFFYNDLCPEVVAVLWRPLFTPRGFSVMVSERVRPVIPDEWKSDTLVTLNVRDILREAEQFTADIVTDYRVFDNRPMEESTRKRKSPAKKQIQASKKEESDKDSSDSDNSDSE